MLGKGIEIFISHNTKPQGVPSPEERSVFILSRGDADYQRVGTGSYGDTEER